MPAWYDASVDDEASALGPKPTCAGAQGWLDELIPPRNTTGIPRAASCSVGFSQGAAADLDDQPALYPNLERP